MNNNTAQIVGRTVAALGVCGAVGVACKMTKSGLPLLGLIFLPGIYGGPEAVQEVVQEVVENKES